MRLDHVSFAAGPDGLASTAQRIGGLLGTDFTTGGVHPRFGTRNMILPLAGGEEWAASRGIDVRRLKILSYFIGSILTGAVTAFAGPIGFVGLIIPHTIRMIAGPDHRILVPASFFLGAAFLVLCDTAARTIVAPTEIPVGVITALLGGPFFIALLKRKRGELW